MNCREVQPLLQLFVDGEMDARKMRNVALHSARCATCEQELRFLENCQEALADHIASAVDGIDMSRIWAGIEPRLAASPRSLSERLRDWFEELDARLYLRVPAFAGAVAVLALAVNVWQGDGATGGRLALEQRPEPSPVKLARFDNSAIVHSIKSKNASVAMLREPDSNTLVLWVNDDGAGSLLHNAALGER